MTFYGVVPNLRPIKIHFVGLDNNMSLLLFTHKKANIFLKYANFITKQFNEKFLLCTNFRQFDRTLMVSRIFSIFCRFYDLRKVLISKSRSAISFKMHRIRDQPLESKRTLQIVSPIFQNRNSIFGKRYILLERGFFSW